MVIIDIDDDYGDLNIQHTYWGYLPYNISEVMNWSPALVHSYNIYISMA